MAALRSMAAAVAAVVLVGRVQATEVPLPPCLDSFQPFVYAGCFQQQANTQLFPFRTPLSSDNMTVQQCAAECKGNGYRYAGLVYHGVCYCGATVGGPQVDDSQCKFPCTGKETEKCGGDNVFSVYQDPTFEPIEKVTIADYEPVGCWTDDSSLGRALAYQQDQLDSTHMTTETCLQACRKGGFPFAGTEFGGECWCGVVTGKGTNAASATDCKMPCNGKSSEMCGGPSRLSLYVAHKLQSQQPCGSKPPPVSSSTTLSTSAISTPSSPYSSPPSSAPSTTSLPSTSSTTCSTSTISTPSSPYSPPSSAPWPSSSPSTSSTTCSTSTISTPSSPYSLPSSAPWPSSSPSTSSTTCSTSTVSTPSFPYSPPASSAPSTTSLPSMSSTSSSMYTVSTPCSPYSNSTSSSMPTVSTPSSPYSPPVSSVPSTTSFPSTNSTSSSMSTVSTPSSPYSNSTSSSMPTVSTPSPYSPPASSAPSTTSLPSMGSTSSSMSTVSTPSSPYSNSTSSSMSTVSTPSSPYSPPASPVPSTTSLPSMGSTSSSMSTVSTPSSPYSPPASSAPSTTNGPSSSTSQWPSTTTSSSVCVTTTVVPPACEYKCGKWCSSPLPDWDNVPSCKKSWSSCAVQIASCFKNAGWPDSMQCFEFGQWCADVLSYCDSQPDDRCRKTDFWGWNPPKGGAKPPQTMTVTTPCAPPMTTAVSTTTTPSKPPATTTSKCPIPTPKNICKQPNNPRHGYGPGKPVGGIELPVMTCNNLAADWPLFPFKLYNDAESHRSARYSREECGGACADACREQHDNCVTVYKKGCEEKDQGWSWWWRRSNAAGGKGGLGAVAKRTFLGWNDSGRSASKKCKAQYEDCLWVNRDVTGWGKCPAYEVW